MQCALCTDERAKGIKYQNIDGENMRKVLDRTVFISTTLISTNIQYYRIFISTHYVPLGPDSPLLPICPLNPTSPGSPGTPTSPDSPYSPEI